MATPRRHSRETIAALRTFAGEIRTALKDPRGRWRENIRGADFVDLASQALEELDGPTPDAGQEAAPDAANAIRACYQFLKTAREFATVADAPRTLARIRLALTSCQGAIRNAEGRQYRDR